MTSNTRKQDVILPFYVRFTTRVLSNILKLSILLMLSVLLVVAAIILDSKAFGFQYLKKAGVVIGLFGVLLSLKHRLLKAFSSYVTYDSDINGDGLFFCNDIISQCEAQKVKSKAIEEACGVWMMLIGTILSVFSFWQALLLLIYPYLLGLVDKSEVVFFDILQAISSSLN
ncbi:hypothetical protein [Shewanella sp. CAL98-MNA-CIBAN-0140]|uniref:hypothetical protein n=1 Tax=unclassified Shewanella TaxID=196818 RepID=UPI00332D2FBA